MKRIIYLFVLIACFSTIQTDRCFFDETVDAVRLTQTTGVKSCRQVYSENTCYTASKLIELVRKKTNLNNNNVGDEEEEDELRQVCVDFAPVPGTGCRKFFRCANGNPFQQDCPSGLIFDVNINACNWPNKVNCNDQIPSRPSGPSGPSGPFGPSGPSRPSRSIPSRAEFQNAVTSNGFRSPTSQQYRSFSSQLSSRGNINTKREAAMFLSQILHESGGLQFKRETRCQSNLAQCDRDYPLTGAGIRGKHYYGRGYIQLTHDYNYAAASRDLYGDNRLIRDPDQVANNEDIAWATAFWFWRRNVGVLSSVKNGLFGASTNAINGNLECRGPNKNLARKRFQIYRTVLRAFNVMEKPIEQGCYN